ncbi:MAG: beta-galactosidase [Thermotogota bacterium]|nr:beta-galactosidase [Thermotogota bacterium]
MFPKDFLFGCSMSGFQFEMGANGDPDERSDWYIWVRAPGNLISGTVSGDLPEHGTGYWKNFSRIHDLAELAGMNTLRVGIEWSRVFPYPTFEAPVKVIIDEDNRVTSMDIDISGLKEMEKLANLEALEHYREILLDLKKRGFTVIVDLSHFTLPIWIHNPIAVNRGEKTDATGWVNVRTVVEFAKYATFMAWKLDDIVDMWSTMNEPQIVSQLGYLTTRAGFPPAYFSPRMYIHSLINQAQAHARAYDAMKKFTRKPVGVIYSFTWIDLLEDNKEVKESAERFHNWEFMDMITEGNVYGTFRDDVKHRLDFIGVNYYTRTVIKPLQTPFDMDGYTMTWQVLPGYGYSSSPQGIALSGRPTSDMGWEIYPEGLYGVLSKLQRRYNLPMIVTENGIADHRDALRPYFLMAHLHAVEKALEDGIDVRGYLHWSLVDNYEWAQGFKMRFGLVHVEFPARSYTPRPSYYLYQKLIAERSVEPFLPLIKYPYDMWGDNLFLT